MQSLADIKQQLLKQWQRHRFHQQWLQESLPFPVQIKLKRPNDKTLLHEYTSVTRWQQQLEKDIDAHPGVSLSHQQINFATMGRQRLPVVVEFADMEALARFCGKWGQWQQFTQDIALLNQHLPQLKDWQPGNVSHIVKYAGSWLKLIAISHYFQAHHQPSCYLRELKIPGVDSKFIEGHKQIVKALLDQVLPQTAINEEFEHISDHGFEQRFGLKFDQPQIRFRLLDPMLSSDMMGIDDLSIPVSQFAKLDLLIDRVYITENQTNGLAFPPQKNSLVIFGKGYGIQTLKQVLWLQQCQIWYWGDIDTDGFAMLSQLRGYFPRTQSLLMDESTLQACKPFWGEEPANKKQTPDELVHLTGEEAAVYQGLKAGRWQPRLRLEQERVPFEMLLERLKTP